MGGKSVRICYLTDLAGRYFRRFCCMLVSWVFCTVARTRIQFVFAFDFGSLIVCVCVFFPLVLLSFFRLFVLPHWNWQFQIEFCVENMFKWAFYRSLWVLLGAGAGSFIPSILPYDLTWVCVHSSFNHSHTQSQIKMVIIIRSIKRARKFCNCRIKMCFGQWIFQGRLIQFIFRTI